MTNTKILIVDDHQIIREGLRTLLASQPGFEIAGEAKNGLEAIEMAQKLSPDLIIMDVAMPEMNGIDAVKRIKKELPDTKIIALSMHLDEKYVSAMLEAGASSYLLKQGSFEELISAINTVLDNKVFLSPEIAAIVTRGYLRALSDTDTSAASILTERELETLECIADGYTTKETAHKLNVSVKTIEARRKNIMQKTGIDNIPGLVKYAIREKLVTI
jgi:DNA-binding NarL/FixJ family response regulator